MATVSMHAQKQLPVGGLARSRSAVTLIEILIVITIIAILLSLLFPALHAARQAAERSACSNNLRQLDLGLREYVDLYHGYFPLPAAENRPGGWVLEVLPYIEEIPLMQSFDPRQPLTSPKNLAAARSRPSLFFCPVTPEIDSTLEGIQVTNYLVIIDNVQRDRPSRDRSWQLKDAPAGSRYPWCTSPEKLPVDSVYPAPHSSAFGLLE